MDVLNALLISTKQHTNRQTGKDMTMHKEGKIPDCGGDIMTFARGTGGPP